MARQLGIIDAQGRQFGKGRLECRKQFRLQLAVETAAVIKIRFVAGDIRIEQDGVHHAVAVLAKAAQAHEERKPRRIVIGLKRHFTGRTVLIADDFFHVEIVDPLVLSGIAAKGKALFHLRQELMQHFS